EQKHETAGVGADIPKPGGMIEQFSQNGVGNTFCPNRVVVLKNSRMSGADGRAHEHASVIVEELRKAVADIAEECISQEFCRSLVAKIISFRSFLRPRVI